MSSHYTGKVIVPALAGDSPGAPQRDCGYCQHHPSQFPISNFFDHPYHVQLLCFRSNERYRLGEQGICHYVCAEFHVFLAIMCGKSSDFALIALCESQQAGFPAGKPLNRELKRGDKSMIEIHLLEVGKPRSRGFFFDPLIALVR